MRDAGAGGGFGGGEGRGEGAGEVAGIGAEVEDVGEVAVDVLGGGGAG